MLALARKIVAGEADDADSVESVLAQAQQVAAEAEALLVDAEFVAVAPAKPLRGRARAGSRPTSSAAFRVDWETGNSVSNQTIVGKSTRWQAGLLQPRVAGSHTKGSPESASVVHEEREL